MLQGETWQKNMTLKGEIWKSILEHAIIFRLFCVLMMLAEFKGYFRRKSYGNSPPKRQDGVDRKIVFIYTVSYEITIYVSMKE